MDSSIYASLPLQPGEIRLLRLLPDPDKDAPIRCSLITYTLHNLDDRPHLYEALSYVWGDPNEVFEISVSGQPVNVTLNLHAALRRLRDHYFDRIVWVDAICINQSNKAEVATQILSMANIYGQASRVIVWLGEAADDSDVVLERIRAAESSRQLKQNQEDKVLHQLLERPWFRRVWVLQEAAAARHIRILCGSKDLDGYAFCAGLQNLSKNETFHPIVHLIKRATFRSPHVSQILGRTSLSVYRLGHLLDLYHTYEASKRHDKVYALLGLSSDNLENAGLSPDYDVPWNKLLQRLVRHLLGRNVRIDTWQDREIAMISGRGYIIGDVTSTGQGHYTIRMSKTGKERKWALPGSAKAVQCGDIVCLLQGASRATIIRLCYDHFAVVMIEAGSSVVEHPEISESQYRFTLLWSWELSGGEWQNNLQDTTLKDALGQSHMGQDLEYPLIRRARLCDIATILYDLKKFEKTTELLQRMMRDSDHAQKLELLEKLLMCYTKAGRKNEVDNTILQAAQVRNHQQADLWNILDRTSLCSQFPWNWRKIERIVHVLDLQQSEFTEKEICDRAVDLDDEVVSILLSKRSDLFRFGETVLFVLFTRALDKRSRDNRIRQLLRRHNEEPAQAVERILKLIVALQTGPAAVIRIMFQGLIIERSYGTKNPLRDIIMFRKTITEKSYGITSKVRVNEQRQLLDFLSQQKEHEIHVTEEIRAAAAGNPSQAVENLISLLQEPEAIQVTEEMLKIAAAKGTEDIMEFLLRKRRDDVHITEDVLKAASENLLQGRQIIRCFSKHNMVKFDVQKLRIRPPIPRSLHLVHAPTKIHTTLSQPPGTLTHADPPEPASPQITPTVPQSTPIPARLEPFILKPT